MLIIIFTGLAAGAIHVVSGADHLIAIAPSALRHPKIAIKNGFAWGLGHSTGVILLASIAIFLKDLAHIQKVSSLAELAVGISLLIVGILALRTAFGLNIHSHKHIHFNGSEHKHIHLHFHGKQKHNSHAHASTSLGVLHGLAGANHLLAALPALALSGLDTLYYMAAYIIGSITIMGLFTYIISIASMKSSRKLLPLIFGIAGSISIITGLFWIQKTSGVVI